MLNLIIQVVLNAFFWLSIVAIVKAVWEISVADALEQPMVKARIELIEKNSSGG